MNRWMTGVALAAVLALGGGTAAAQSSIAPRVDKLEREMRAVQRKVFPNGGGELVAPDIQPEAAPTALPGTPATSPVADLTQRVTALESGLATLTGQVEQAENRLRQAEDALTAYKRATDGRLRALEEGGGGGGAGPSPIAAGGDAPRANGGTLQLPGAGAGAAPATGDRAARVRAVIRPATGDGAEDGYLYGFRLWDAKLYPESEAALKEVVAKYPTHRRASFAQNLLGRAYLDEGKPSLASIAFYDNYKKMPDGERAPDSLFYLAQALVKLNKPADACKVYAELSETYPEKIGAGMKADIATGRSAAKCK